MYCMYLLSINQTITNVVPGRIAPDSTDAVNGSQLYLIINTTQAYPSALANLHHIPI